MYEVRTLTICCCFLVNKAVVPDMFVLRTEILWQRWGQTDHVHSRVRGDHAVGCGAFQMQPVWFLPLDLLQIHHDAPVSFLRLHTRDLPLL